MRESDRIYEVTGRLQGDEPQAKMTIVTTYAVGDWKGGKIKDFLQQAIADKLRVEFPALRYHQWLGVNVIEVTDITERTEGAVLAVAADGSNSLHPATAKLFWPSVKEVLNRAAQVIVARDQKVSTPVDLRLLRVGQVVLFQQPTGGKYRPGLIVKRAPYLFVVPLTTKTGKDQLSRHHEMLEKYGVPSRFKGRDGVFASQFLYGVHFDDVIEIADTVPLSVVDAVLAKHKAFVQAEL